MNLTSQDLDRISQSPFGDLKLSQIPPNWRDHLAEFDLIERVWDKRACLVCQKLGRCQHREPEFDMAEIEARNRKLLRKQPVAA